jgi:hypothetical protein
VIPIAMSPYEGLAVLIIVQTVVGLVGLSILGLQLREARRDTARLWTATAGMVHQEAEKILDAMRRQGTV